MRKIGIYLERKPESGGAFQYCLAMLKALSYFPTEQYKIVAFCTYPEWTKITDTFGIDSRIVQKNNIQRVLHYTAERVFTVNFYRRFCQFLHPLAKALRQTEMDCCIYPCGDKISFMMNHPSIVTVFDLMHRYLKDFPEIADPSVYKSRERSYSNIARYSDRIFVDSKVGKQQMLECYGDTSSLLDELNKKTKVLPMIAPDYVYDYVQKEKRPKPDTFFSYFFYPAQLWKHKNHKNLILAAAALKREGAEVNLVFCGAGKNANDEIMELIRKNKLDQQIKILGYVDNNEMVAYYQHARALIMPTYGGPTNIPQLEAFVLGCPVATSRIFGIPEQVGDSALLFDPDDVNEIKECMRVLWENNEICEDLIQKGYKRAAEYGEPQYRETLLQYLNDYFEGR